MLLSFNAKKIVYRNLIEISSQSINFFFFLVPHIYIKKPTSHMQLLDSGPEQKETEVQFKKINKRNSL